MYCSLNPSKGVSIHESNPSPAEYQANPFGIVRVGDDPQLPRRDGEADQFTRLGLVGSALEDRELRRIPARSGECRDSLGTAEFDPRRPRRLLLQQSWRHRTALWVNLDVWKSNEVRLETVRCDPQLIYERIRATNFARESVKAFLVGLIWPKYPALMPARA